MTTEQIFDVIKQVSVLVIGDVMLDRYQYGSVHRISPEAPVPILNITHEESRLGGAANVALNCVALGAKVTLAATVGNDDGGNTLIQILKENNINTDLILTDKHKPTTTKTRIISRNHQLLRIDEENTDEISSDLEHPFIDKVLKYIQMYKPQVIILEDYNKGLLKENVIQRIIAHGKIYNAVITVDPKEKNFFTYKGVTIFKPNLAELKQAIGNNDTSNVLDNISSIGHNLLHKLDATYLLLTLSEKGIYYQGKNNDKLIPTHPRNIVDVSGAGDTVISVASIFYAVTQDIHFSSLVSNIAGGIVCESVGVVSIDKDRLYEEMSKISNA